MKKQLHIISHSYPYGFGEQFFENEVNELALKFDSIVLYPLVSFKEISRKVPKNVTVNLCICEPELRSSKFDYLKYFRIIFAVLFLEFRKSGKKGFILRKFKILADSVLSANRLGQIFKANISSEYENYYYSFWMNSGALLLSILKQKKEIDDFQFRVNGFDMYEERNEGHYLPFRFFIYKFVKQIFVPSNPAIQYLQGINFFPSKLKLAFHGIYDQGENPFKKNEPHVIVSCASLIDIKRVDKIIDALKLVDENIIWNHYGDGPLADSLKKQAEDLPKNVSYEFKGNRPNSEIIAMYKSTPISLFIHTSETEGFGMAILEAQSFGIPALVIGVGGVVDIVDHSSGIVLAEDATANDIAAAVELIFTDKYNNSVFREAVKITTLQKFGAQRNYEAQYNKIVS